MKTFFTGLVLAASTLALTTSAFAYQSSLKKPEQICSLLDKHGMPVSSQWKKDMWGEYRCAASILTIGDIPPVSTNIAYYVESESEDKASHIYLVLHANDEDSRHKAKSRYQQISLSLFKELAVSMPQGLQTAIVEEKPASFTSPEANIELEVTKGASDTMRLIIRNSAL